MLKTKFSFLFVVFILLLFQSLGCPVYADGDIPIIPSTETQDPGQVIPKSPAVIPLACSVAESQEQINIIIYVPLGHVIVDLENLVDGNCSQWLLLGQVGQTQIPFLGTTGTWRITFTLSNGIKYYGEFDI